MITAFFGYIDSSLVAYRGTLCPEMACLPLKDHSAVGPISPCTMVQMPEMVRRWDGQRHLPPLGVIRSASSIPGDIIHDIH